MRRFVVVLVAAIFLIAASADVFAQDRTQQQQGEQLVVDSRDLPPDLLAKIKARKAEQETLERLTTAGEYAKWGHEVGVAVNETLEAVTDNAAKFADTNVGQFTMFLVAWKVFGDDFMGFIVGIPLLVVGSTVLVWSYRRTCIPRRVLLKKSKEGGKEWGVYDPIVKNPGGIYSISASVAEGERQRTDGPRSRGHWASMHALIAAVFLLLCCILMFAG